MISETTYKLFKFYIKHHLEFKSFFSLKTLINTKMEYKRKLSPENLQDMSRDSSRHGHLLHLAEIKEFSSFDVAR